MLPFKTGQIVLNKDFCGRQDVLRTLTDYITSGNRVYVQGERRVGKTSLVVEAVRRMKGWSLLDVNLMNIQSATDVAKALARALVAMDADETTLIKTLKQLASLRPTLGIDPLTSQPNISFAPGPGNVGLETIESILSIAQSRKKTVVFLDEFQDVERIKDGDVLLARLRGVIQNMSGFPVVYAGSLRNSMDRIFTHPDSPFYKSAMKVNVGPINEAEFGKFISSRFAKGKRKVDLDIIPQVYTAMRGNPGDIQKLCIGLWEASEPGETIGQEKLRAGFDFIWSMEADSYTTIISALSPQQNAALRALAVSGPSRADLEFLDVYDGISLQQSLRKALKRLAATGRVPSMQLLWTGRISVSNQTGGCTSGTRTCDLGRHGRDTSSTLQVYDHAQVMK